MKEIPVYNGENCTSGCGNDFDCPHGDQFDEELGIWRSGKDFSIVHEPAPDIIQNGFIGHFRKFTFGIWPDNGEVRIITN